MAQAPRGSRSHFQKVKGWARTRTHIFSPLKMPKHYVSVLLRHLMYLLDSWSVKRTQIYKEPRSLIQAWRACVDTAPSSRPKCHTCVIPLALSRQRRPECCAHKEPPSSPKGCVPLTSIRVLTSDFQCIMLPHYLRPRNTGTELVWMVIQRECLMIK